MFPQKMINVTVKGRVALDEYPAINDAVSAMEHRLGDDGRVLLRPSGTEPVVRVMIEGRDRAAVDPLCAELASQVETILG
jgi:phosphoglucosamine mutase